jgi:hypothetical protein
MLPRPDKISTKSFQNGENDSISQRLVKISPGITVVCCVVGTLTHISDLTGFDRGEYFQDPDQVRAYFKVEVMERLDPGWLNKTGLAQADLDEMAGAVIHHKWHCSF